MVRADGRLADCKKCLHRNFCIRHTGCGRYRPEGHNTKAETVMVLNYRSDRKRKIIRYLKSKNRR